jgi:hypothetical protein
MGERNRKLHIVGKVSATIVKKIVNIHHLTFKPNELFLFVGYNFYNYNVGDFFDIAINGADKKWKANYNIKLKRIFDEFGREHKNIPEGYKTICLFESKLSLPDSIKRLPSLKTWDFNHPGVFLCSHSDINLLHSPDADALVFSTLEKLLLSTLMKNKKSFSVSELENLLPSESSKFIIDNMLISGSIRRNDGLLELVS